MSVTSPAGFRAAGVTAGLKPSGRPDLALVVNERHSPGFDCDRRLRARRECDFQLFGTGLQYRHRRAPLRARSDEGFNRVLFLEPRDEHHEVCQQAPIFIAGRNDPPERLTRLTIALWLK